MDLTLLAESENLYLLRHCNFQGQTMLLAQPEWYDWLGNERWEPGLTGGRKPGTGEPGKSNDRASSRPGVQWDLPSEGHWLRHHVTQVALRI